MLTDYGYEAYIVDVVDVTEARSITGSRASDDMLEAGIGAAQAAVRNHCGWHVAPSLACTYECESAGFPEIQLPATFVSSVDSVKVDGVAVDFEWKSNGRVRRKDGKPFPSGWGSVVVTYQAGVDESNIRQVVAKLAAASVASSPGVRSESVGSLSVTYSDTEVGISTNVAAVLDRYRLKARP